MFNMTIYILEYKKKYNIINIHRNKHYGNHGEFVRSCTCI